MKKIVILLSLLSVVLGVSAIFASDAASGAASVADVYNQKIQSVKDRLNNKITPEQRQAAADSMANTDSAESTADMSMPNQGGTPNYYGPEPNWAYSPQPVVDSNTGAVSGGIRKFVDSLAGLGSANTNNLGQYLPVAVPDTTTYPGTDYYEISLEQYMEKMHTDLPPTTLRGYVQTNNGTDANGQNTIAPSGIHYLGPIIVAQKDRPVRVKFTNKLPTGTGGDLFLPVDTTVMGAGMGPNGTNYTQNRGTLHLHGGLTPWISDGTPHQWITPAGETTDYPKGVSVTNVPDMPDPGDGSETFYYSNQQNARLLFYHDHSYGITRLNVYAGEAAGYLVTDKTEQDLVASGVIPAEQIPLIIQDKTFVDSSTVLNTDPTWNWGTMPGMPMTGDLWLPHVYMPNQNPNSMNGVNPLGRWDYGPWFWPPWPTSVAPNTLADGTKTPGVPNISMGMESFMDTPVVNGTVYPYLDVQPQAYRFRILNAANDRMWNLQLYVADSTTVSADGRTNTEVKMVPANAGSVWPAGWPTPDARVGGVPDPNTVGPSMIQIGTEGGFLPEPVTLTNIPIGYDLDKKSITVGNVKEHNLLIGPAERADVVVDFSAYAGKTLILYNDAPAAFPAGDPRYDYYTGDPNLTSTGGSNSTLAGYGPNTRTIMQIKVAAATPAPYDAAQLNTALPQAFAASENPIIVPQAPYNTAYNGNFPTDNSAYSRIQDNALTFKPLGSNTAMTINFQPKAIVEQFENTYGRMTGNLGLEMPFTNGLNQTTIPYGYIDPATENIQDSMTPMAPVAGDGTQIWKITHNGVDTHTIHFHLFDVQVVNRVDWAGVVKPPDANELGWKDTVRANPLEDLIVALRPVAPKVPFGVPESVRPLDPTMPIGSTMGFKNVDANGNPITVTNQLTNYGWEYMWHCHLLDHEEMDMMRPVIFKVQTVLPPQPVITSVQNNVITWVDPTPAVAATTIGNPANEIGFTILRSTIAANGQQSAFAQIGTALANQTTFTDTTAVAGTNYVYLVSAYNVSGTVNSTPTGKSIISSSLKKITRHKAVIRVKTSFKSLVWIKYGINNKKLIHVKKSKIFAKKHTITLKGLHKNRKYFYQILAKNSQKITQLKSNISSFKTKK